MRTPKISNNIKYNSYWALLVLILALTAHLYNIDTFGAGTHHDIQSYTVVRF